MPESGPLLYRETELLDLARTLFAIALASQSFFCTALFTRLKVERMPLYLFHNVFLLNLALKTA